MDRDPFWALKELFRALRVQVDLPQTWPVLLVTVILALPMCGFILVTLAGIVVEAWFGQAQIPMDVPGWLQAWVFASGFYLLVLVTLLDDGRKAIIKRLALVGGLAESGRDHKTNRLLEEVEAQCRAAGIARLPDVYVYDQAEFRYGAFAHAGLMDNGRVALPSDWLEHLSDEELRFIVGHELSHIRHRDGFVSALVRSFTVAFTLVPLALCSLPIVMAAVLAAVLLVVSVVMSFVFLVFGGAPLQPLAAWGNSMARLVHEPFFVGPSIILSSLLVVSAVLETYKLWVRRRQELKADELAAALVGGPDARRGIEWVVSLERAGGHGPGPVTADGCRQAMRGVFAYLAWFVWDKAEKTEGERALVVFLSLLANGLGFLLYGLWRAISWIPGTRGIPWALWRLARTHPTSEQRQRHLEKILSARSTNAEVG